MKKIKLVLGNEFHCQGNERCRTKVTLADGQGPAEGSLMPKEPDSLGGKSQGWWQGMRQSWQSLLRHAEHPLCPGKLCREPGDQGLQSSGRAGAVCAPLSHQLGAGGQPPRVLWWSFCRLPTCWRGNAPPGFRVCPKVCFFQL